MLYKDKIHKILLFFLCCFLQYIAEACFVKFILNILYLLYQLISYKRICLEAGNFVYKDIKS